MVLGKDGKRIVSTAGKALGDIQAPVRLVMRGKSRMPV